MTCSQFNEKCLTYGSCWLKIRFYRSDEARMLREQQIRQAAAQRQQEDEEYEAAKRKREFEEEVMELSMQQARRLPVGTQKLLVSTMQGEVESIFKEASSGNGFDVGECVECCFRRSDGGATRAAKLSQWFPCKITFVDIAMCTAHVEFLDGDYERVRQVPFTFLRYPLSERRRARGIEFVKLRERWLNASPFEDEINRLTEVRNAQNDLSLRELTILGSPMLNLKIQAKNSQRELWNLRNVRESPTVKPARKIDMDADTVEARPRSRSRPLIARPTSSSLSSRQVLERQQIDKLFQAAADLMVTYDRAFAHTHTTVKACCKKYSTAVLYRERFHAFDDFGIAMKALVEVTVDTLGAVKSWKQLQIALGGKAARSVSFIWNGKDFSHTVGKSFSHVVASRVTNLLHWKKTCRFLARLNFLQTSRSLLSGTVKSSRLR